MGCDIHSIAQVKKDGKWVTKIPRVADDNRDYNSFAILANVRNGYGVAAVTTGEGWTPIAQPRGLPNDIELIEESVESPVWYWDFDEKKEEPETTVWLGDHSHSWLTLDEIEAYWEINKHGTYLRVGVLDREQYEKLKSGETPTQWCGGICGPNIKVVHYTQVTHEPDYTHVQCEWSVPREKAVHYLPDLIEALRKLRDDEKVSSRDIRFVFGFDS